MTLGEERMIRATLDVCEQVLRFFAMGTRPSGDHIVCATILLGETRAQLAARLLTTDCGENTAMTRVH
jgi:hypothetical protein